MDRSFAQVTGEETLVPGATEEYSGVWATPAPGRYEAVGRLVSTSHPVEIAVPFEVP
jgi:hypothetical protein